MNLFETVDINYDVLKLKTDKMIKKIVRLKNNPNLNKSDKIILQNCANSFREFQVELLKIGYSIPEFFAGDLLDFKNYITYFDSLFFEKKQIPSKTERKKGNSQLVSLAKKEIKNLYDPHDWKALSSEKKQQVFVETERNVIYNFASNLPSTQILNDKLNGLKEKFENLKKPVAVIDFKYREKE